MGVCLTDLNLQAKQWQTPSKHQFDKRRQVGQTERSELLLPAQAKQWQTPQTPKGGGSSRSGDRIGEPLLPGQAKAWPAPTLADQVEVCSRPDPTTSTHGAASSNSTRRLNPRFVEWLMGMPDGWTSFACSETEWSRYRRRMRSVLCGLVCQRERGEA